MEFPDKIYRGGQAYTLKGQTVLNQSPSYDQALYMSEDGRQVKIYRSDVANEWQPCGEGDNICTCTAAQQCGYIQT